MSRKPRKRPAGDKTKAVGYVRASTREQGLTPDVQRAAIEAWATREEVEVVAWHLDQGVSGAADLAKRPALLAAIAAVAEHNAARLIVAKRDRLARGDVVSIAMIERLVERAGATVAAADGVGVGDGPEDALLKTLVDAFAAYEREIIRARTKAALAAKRARGADRGRRGRTGQVPYGWVVDPKDPTRQVLRPCRREQAAIEEARRLRAKGLSIQWVAEELTRKMGRVARGRRFHPSMVWRMVREEGG